MKTIMESVNDNSRMKVKAKSDALCFKVFWTNRAGKDMYGFHYITREEAEELLNALVDWLDWSDVEAEEEPRPSAEPDLDRIPHTCSFMTPRLYCTIHDVSMANCCDTCYVCPHFDGRRDDA